MVVQFLNLNKVSHNKYKDVIARVEAKCNKIKFIVHSIQELVGPEIDILVIGKLVKKEKNTQLQEKGGYGIQFYEASAGELCGVMCS